MCVVLKKYFIQEKINKFCVFVLFLLCAIKLVLVVS